MSNEIRTSVKPYIGADGVVLRVFINGNESSEFYSITNPDLQIAYDMAKERLSQLDKMTENVIWRAIK